MASYLWDASFFTKFAFNLMYRNVKSEPVVVTTIKDYLWNFSDPILDVAQSIAPSMVPTKNMGILTRVSLHNQSNPVYTFSFRCTVILKISSQFTWVLITDTTSFS